MKKFAFAVVLLCAAVCPTFAQMTGSISGTQAKGSGESQVVQRLEHDWVDATKTLDIDKLSPILADDWVGIGFGGDKITKQSYLAEVKSGVTKLQSFEFGPMDVKILGNVAVVQGSDIGGHWGAVANFL
jgi:Domain of unknown function (DUF4440)